MTAELLDLLRRELPALVRQAVRAEMAAQRDRLTPAQRAIMKIIAGLYSPNEPFTTSAAIDAARFDPDARKRLHSACDTDVQRLGILLRQIADSGATLDGLRLVRLPAEAGSRRWVLEAVESL